MGRRSVMINIAKFLIFFSGSLWKFRRWEIQIKILDIVVREKRPFMPTDSWKSLLLVLRQW